MTWGTLPGSDRSTVRKQDVLSGFMRRVGMTDLLVIIWAVLGAQLIRFGPDAQDAKLPAGAATFLDLRYTVLTAVLILAWLLMLRIHGAYDRRLLSQSRLVRSLRRDRGGSLPS